VAGILSLFPSSPHTASGARAATRARRQSSGATLPATNSCHGSRQHQPTMDGMRGALLPLAKGFRLSATQTHMWEKCHVTESWVRVPAEALGWSLAPGRTGLSGLPTGEKTSLKGVHRGLSNYPPYSMATPLVCAPLANKPSCTSLLTWLNPCPPHWRRETRRAGRSDGYVVGPCSSADGS
jgi:hypothetical protein